MPKKKKISQPDPDALTVAYVRKSGVSFPADCKTEESRAAYVEYLHRTRVAEIEADARRNNHAIDKWYIDFGISGRGQYLNKRIEMLRLTDDAKDGRIARIYTRDLQRLFRNTMQQEIWFAEISNAGVEVYLDGAKQLEDAKSKMIRVILGAVNEAEAEKYSENAKEHFAQIVSDKEWDGRSTPPYGYKRGPNKFIVPDEVTAPRLVTVFETVIALGGNCNAAATRLTALFPSPKGSGPWSAEAVAWIVQNRIYEGITHFGESGDVDISDKITLLIDAETVQRARGLVTDRRADMTERHRPKRRLFTTYGGLIVCGHCAGRVTGRRVWIPPYRYYACTGHVRDTTCCPQGRNIAAARIDAAVGVLLEALAQADAPPVPAVKPAPRRVNGATPARIDKLRLAKTRLVRTWAMGEIDDDLYETEIRRVNAELSALESELSLTRDEETARPDAGLLSSARRAELLASVRALWTAPLDTDTLPEDLHPGKRSLLEGVRASFLLSIPLEHQRPNGRGKGGKMTPDFILTLRLPGVGTLTQRFSAWSKM